MSSSSNASSDPSSDALVSAPIAIVGAGAVGTALGRRLVDRGYRVCAVLSRRLDPADHLARRLGANVASTDLADLPPEARFVFVCVPDDAIGSVADSLAAVAHPWSETFAAHTAGGRPAAALAPLADAGARILSVHPMQTFTDDTPPAAFDGIVAGLEGDDEAVAVAEAMVRRLGARPVVLSPHEKALYHGAAALASNGLVALLASVREVLDTAGIDGDDADALLRPLVDQTWQNLQEGPPEAVLTGPAARGDQGTVDAHLDALSEAAPHLLPLYAALTTEMVRVAVRGGRLNSTDADALLDRLHDRLEGDLGDSQRGRA